jgi:hypothetical protein
LLALVPSRHVRLRAVQVSADVTAVPQDIERICFVLVCG